jgi:hypothetical protein
MGNKCKPRTSNLKIIKLPIKLVRLGVCPPNKNLLQTLHSYFSHSLKKHFKFHKACQDHGNKREQDYHKWVKI